MGGGQRWRLNAAFVYATWPNRAVIVWLASSTQMMPCTVNLRLVGWSAEFALST